MQINSTAAERALLGLVLRKPERADEIIPFLQVEHFQGDDTKAMFKAISSVYESTSKVDRTKVAHWFEDSNSGYDHVRALIADSNSLDAKGLLDLVKREGNLRRVQMALQGLIMDGIEYATAAEYIAEVHGRLQAIQSASVEDREGKLAREYMRGYVEELDRRRTTSGLQGLSTGWTAVDEKLGGLRPGNMIVIAGCPSMGKSTFALNICAHNALNDGKSVAVFSLEVNQQDMLDKTIAADAGVPMNRLLDGTIAEDDEKLARVTQSIGKINKANLLLDNRGGTNINEIRATCFRMKRDIGLDLVMIDYLGLMRDVEGGKGKYEQVTNNSNAVQQLSRDLQVPVLVVCQINRNVSNREDKRPSPSDLRDSGAIEADADVIIFPYRDAYYATDDKPSDYVFGDVEIAEVIISKAKMGERGSVFLRWQGGYQRFANDFPDIDRRQMIQERREQRQQSKKQGGRRGSGMY